MCTLGFISRRCCLVLHLFEALFTSALLSEKLRQSCSPANSFTSGNLGLSVMQLVIVLISMIHFNKSRSNNRIDIRQLRIVNAIRSSAVLFSSQHKNKTAVLLFERKRIVAKVRFWVWTFCILFYKIVL